MPGTRPAASVIVPAYHSHDTIARSLASLLSQTFQDFELIVVDSSPDDRSEKIVRESLSRVRYVRTPKRLLPHEARNAGGALAAGDVFVFTDPDCVAEPDWLQRLMTHHGHGRDVVGGSIRSSPGWWNQSVTFTKYPWWDPMSRGGVRPEIPTGNFSLSRAVWDEVQGFRGQFFAGDSEICWRIRAAGHVIWFDPAAVVTHTEHAPAGPFARERIARGRDFGATRLRTQAWRKRRCAGYLLAAPALPVVMTARSLKYALRGHYVGRWLPTAPVQFFGNACWCLGEADAHLRWLIAR